MASLLPDLHGTALDGTALVLPRDLPPMATVLLFGYQHEARQDIGLWKRALDAAGIPWMSLPVAQEGTPAEALEGIAAAMRHHAPERDWGHTVMVHEGGTALLMATGWVPDAFAKVLLVDGDGEVLFHHGGPCTDAAVEGLTTAF
ncbi:MAG TPA: hypothetical protein VJ570_00070 [Holophagaceae bacterium]|nr:hypothetical protein [Holophagaceae bacterium]